MVFLVRLYSEATQAVTVTALYNQCCNSVVLNQHGIVADMQETLKKPWPQNRLPLKSFISMIF